MCGARGNEVEEVEGVMLGCGTNENYGLLSSIRKDTVLPAPYAIIAADWSITRSITGTSTGGPSRITVRFNPLNRNPSPARTAGVSGLRGGYADTALPKNACAYTGTSHGCPHLPGQAADTDMLALRGPTVTECREAARNGGNF